MPLVTRPAPAGPHLDAGLFDSAHREPAVALRWTGIIEGVPYLRYQITTASMVMTRFAGREFLHLPPVPGHYQVIHSRRELRRLPPCPAPNGTRVPLDALGRVRAEVEAVDLLVDGLRCTRYRIWSERGHLSLRGRMFVATIPCLARLSPPTPLCGDGWPRPPGLRLPPGATIVRFDTLVTAQHLRRVHSCRLSWALPASPGALQTLQRISRYDPLG
jgi:hypothetical protein